MTRWLVRHMPHWLPSRVKHWMWRQFWKQRHDLRPYYVITHKEDEHEP